MPGLDPFALGDVARKPGKPRRPLDGDLGDEKLVDDLSPVLSRRGHLDELIEHGPFTTLNHPAQPRSVPIAQCQRDISGS